MNEASPRRRVVIVDDHAMFRTGVRAEIASAVEVVGEAADVDEAVAVVAASRPDVVLLDVHLPGGGGVEVMRRVAPRVPETKFLALSVSDAAEDVIGTIRGGARGYVTKSITGPELVSAIDRVADGDAVFSPRLAGFVLDATGENALENVESAAFGIQAQLETRTQHQLTLRVDRSYEDLLVPFFPFQATGVPIGSYWFTEASLNYNPPGGAIFKPQASISGGQYYDGMRLSGSLSPTWAASPNVTLGGSYGIDRIDFDDRDQDFTSHLVRFRSDFTFTTRTSASVTIRAPASAASWR